MTSINAFDGGINKVEANITCKMSKCGDSS